MEKTRPMIKVSRGCLGAEELDAVRRAFEYGYFGHAANVMAFEDVLKNYLGASHVIAVASGTAALHLALEALGIGPGDEVILPSLTFVASFQAVSATGAKPVACDVDPKTLLLDLDDVQKKVTPRTKAVMPVHYAGNPCDLDGLLRLKKETGIRIVEDAAHAFGSTYKGRKIGGIGDVACFSFDSVKNITCGEGGAVVCSDPILAAKVREKRLLGIDRREGLNEGKRWLYEISTRGYRYHMGNINAAIGLEQLKKVDAFVARRRAIARRYDAAFREESGLVPLPLDYQTVAPHIYVLRVKGGRRDALMAHLDGEGVETTIHYIPNHRQPLYAEPADAFPVTEAAYGELLSLPLHCGLTDADVDTVIRSVSDFASKRRSS
jgi:perosamine synthetase